MLGKLKKVWRIDLFQIYLYCSHLEINLWIQYGWSPEVLEALPNGAKKLSGEESNVQGPAIMRWRETLQWKLGVTTQTETKRKVWQKCNGSIAPVRAKEWSRQPGRAIDLLNHRSNQQEISLPKASKGAKGHHPKDQKN